MQTSLVRKESQRMVRNEKKENANKKEEEAFFNYNNLRKKYHK